MHKRLYQLIAVLLLPLFLVACNEHGAESTVDKDQLAKTLQTAMDTAKEIDNLNLKAYGMAQVGRGMATVDKDKANVVLNEAMNLAIEARSPKYAQTLAGLRADTEKWSAKDKEQVADALDRIEKGNTRVWVIRAIAEGIMVNDKDSARVILAKAGDDAAKIPDAKYRDMDLRSVSGLMAKIDVDAATEISSRISDPRVKAWALTEIGKTAASSDADKAKLIIKNAAEVAKSAPAKITPTSDILVEGVSEETRELVLGTEAAKITETSAEAVASAAAAMYPLDYGTARMMADDASEMATGIDSKKYPYTRAYTLSNIAIDVAGYDVSKAREIADKIDVMHPDAKTAASLAIIKAMSSGSNSSAVLTEINNAVTVANTIEDEYVRAKSLAALAEAAIPYNKDKAIEIAGSIEEELGHEIYAYSELKDGVLSDVAVALVGEDDELAKKIVDPKPDDYLKDHTKYIVETRFANAATVHLKAGTYLAMADKVMATDQKAAMKLYSKASGAAADSKSTRLQWEIARRICKADTDKLFDYAATIPPGDYTNQALALADIAADWSAKGNPSAGMVWDMAAKAANTLPDAIDSAEVLNKVAGQCAAYDKDKATGIYGMSMKRIEKIGSEA